MYGRTDLSLWNPAGQLGIGKPGCASERLRLSERLSRVGLRVSGVQCNPLSPIGIIAMVAARVSPTPAVLTLIALT